MRRRLSHSGRWTLPRVPLAVKVNAWQAWCVIAGAAGLIVVLLYLVQRVAS